MITISTHLHSGIYASDGGGQTVVHYTLATGPRNLLRAIRLLDTHRQEMRDGFGNIGCGASWLSIDGVRMDDYALDEVDRDDMDAMTAWDRREGPRPTPRTVKARQLLAEVVPDPAGYAARRDARERRITAELDRIAAAEDAVEDAEVARLEREDEDDRRQTAIRHHDRPEDY